MNCSFLGLIIILVLFIGMIMGFCLLIEWRGCIGFQETTGNYTEFAIWGSGEDLCLIEIDGKMIPTDKWRVNSGN